MKVACEDARLQTESGVIHLGQGGLEIRKPRQDRHRPEGFLLTDFQASSDTLQQGRVQHRPGAVAAAQHGRTGTAGFMDPGLQPGRLRLVDHRTDEGGLLARIAADQGSGLPDQQVAQGVIDLIVDQDPLHPDAGLARLVEGPEDDPLGGVFQIAVAVDDDGGIAPQFQHHLLLSGPGLERPADLRGAGEGQQFEPVVGGEQVRPLTRGRQDGEGPHRQIRLGQNLTDDQGPQRRPRCGFHHEWTPDRQGRCDLVSGQVERKVEGRDEGARPDRHPFPHPLIALRARRNVERLDLSGHPYRLLGGNAEGVDQSGHLAARIPDRLSGLDAQGMGQFVGPLLEAFHTMGQHGLPLIGRHPRHGPGRLDRRADGTIDQGGVSQGDPRRHPARVFVGHLQVLVGRDRLVGQVEGVGGFQGRHGTALRLGYGC